MRGLILVALLGAPPAPSELAKEVDRLNALVAASDWQAASRLARQIEARIAAKAPLDVSDGQALSKLPVGMGMYEPLRGGVVRGEELYLYAQVRNHGLRRSKGGFELHLVSDLVVLSEEGEELAKDVGLGESRYTARAAHRDTFVVIALRARGLPSGAYRARLVINYRVGGSRGQVEIPFAIP